MKKILTGIIVAVLAISMLLTFTACNKYKWDAVGGMEDADKAVVNNGSLVVKQGNYVYHVNGVNSETLSSASDNKWGNASIKGSILKSKVKEDGSLECLGVVVPKTFYSGYNGAGLYIYGQWLYYTSRSIKTDNAGNVVSGVEYLRTTLDGTKTQTIADIESTSDAFIFTPNGLLYAHDSDIHFIAYNDKKVEKDTVVLEDYASLYVAKDQSAMFYVKAHENTLVSGQILGMVNAKGEKKDLIKADEYFVGSEGNYYEDLSTQFELNILGLGADKTLYYTKTCVDAEGKVGTYAYKFDDAFNFNKDSEVKLANTALTTIYPISAEKGVLDVSAAAVKLYKPMEGDEENVSKEVTFSGQMTIAFEDAGYVYYTISSVLYRANLINEDGTLNEGAYEEKVLGNTVGATYGAAKLMDGYVYYEDTKETSYVYRFELAAYKVENNKVVMPKSYIVSGYKSYTYEKDADFILNKDDEAIKDKIPQYIAEKDVESYITNHKADKEA